MNFFSEENNNITSEESLFSNRLNDDMNLFTTSLSQNEEAETQEVKRIQYKRFNDFDTKILEETEPIKKLKNTSLKLELQIESTEKELKKTREQLNVLRVVQHENDVSRIKLLEEKEKGLIDKLKSLKKDYKNIGSSPTLANYISDFIYNLNNIINTVRNLIVSSELHQLGQKQKMKNDIKQLMMIQKQIKELTLLKVTPYGEKEENLNNYIAFLAKANKLNCQLTKSLNNQINFQKRARLFILHYYKRILKVIKSNKTTESELFFGKPELFNQ